MKNNIIYLRVSTEEQNPELQLDNCKQLATKLNIIDYEVLSDKVSGWKELERNSFSKIKTEIKHRHIKTLIVWDIDRLYRNRKKLVAFFELCKMYKCKIYSFRQQWLEEINKAPEPWNDMIINMMLNVMGWMAEDESNKKSDRVNNAIIKVDKEGNKLKRPISYKGKIWGKPEITNIKMIDTIFKLHKEGISIQKISESKEVFYYDKNNNKKKASVFLIWTILKNKRGQEEKII